MDMEESENFWKANEDLEKINQAAIRSHKQGSTKFQHRAMREAGQIKCPYCERYLAQLD